MRLRGIGADEDGESVPVLNLTLSPETFRISDACGDWTLEIRG